MLCILDTRTLLLSPHSPQQRIELGTLASRRPFGGSVNNRIIQLQRLLIARCVTTVSGNFVALHRQACLNTENPMTTVRNEPVTVNATGRK